MIVTVGSVRGAPGATSWALLLGAAWPIGEDGKRVVLEADPDGGVIGARYGLGVEPGALRFVTGVRRNSSVTDALDGSSRVLNEHLSVLPGAESGEQARSLWSDSAHEIAHRLADDSRAWIVDVGRTDEANPSLAFCAQSAATLLVVGARPEDLVQAPPRVASLKARSPYVAVLVSGSCPYTRAEITEFSRADEAFVIYSGATILEDVGALLAGRRGRRSWLWRQALHVAAALHHIAVARGVVSAEVAGA